MRKTESVAKLKKQIKELRIKNDLMGAELYAYKAFTTNLYKTSLNNMNEQKYTTAFWLVKTIQDIHYRYGAPALYWSDK